jgi:IS30 family transposase
MEKLAHGKQALHLAKAVIKRLFAYKNTVHTITSDNGSEFAAHELIAKNSILSSISLIRTPHGKEC